MIRLELKVYDGLKDEIPIPDILKTKKGDLTVGDELSKDPEYILNKKLHAVLSLRHELEEKSKSPRKQTKKKPQPSEIDVDIDKTKLIEDIMNKIKIVDNDLKDIAIKDQIEIPVILRTFKERNELMKGRKLNEKTKEELQDIQLALNKLQKEVKV